MEAQRQMQHMLEIFGHDGEAAAMGQAVGVQRDEHRGQDGEQRESDPGGHQRGQLGPLHGVIVRLSVRQLVDDATKKHRFRELRGRQAKVGRHENQGEGRLGPQQAENPDIDL